MNEKEAREMLRLNSGKKYFNPREYETYLEAIEKAKGLEKALKKALERLPAYMTEDEFSTWGQTENNRVRKFIENTLAQWGKEK